MSIKPNPPSISPNGDLDILRTNTSRAVAELHLNLLYLDNQYQELRKLIEGIPTKEQEKALEE